MKASKRRLAISGAALAAPAALSFLGAGAAHADELTDTIQNGIDSYNQTASDINNLTDQAPVELPKLPEVPALPEGSILPSNQVRREDDTVAPVADVQEPATVSAPPATPEIPNLIDEATAAFTAQTAPKGPAPLDRFDIAASQLLSGTADSFFNAAGTGAGVDLLAGAQAALDRVTENPNFQALTEGIDNPFAGALTGTEGADAFVNALITRPEATLLQALQAAGGVDTIVSDPLAALNNFTTKIGEPGPVVDTSMQAAPKFIIGNTIGNLIDLVAAALLAPVTFIAAAFIGALPGATIGGIIGALNPLNTIIAFISTIPGAIIGAVATGLPTLAAAALIFAPIAVSSLLFFAVVGAFIPLAALGAVVFGAWLLFAGAATVIGTILAIGAGIAAVAIAAVINPFSLLFALPLGIGVFLIVWFFAGLLISASALIPTALFVLGAIPAIVPGLLLGGALGGIIGAILAIIAIPVVTVIGAVPDAIVGAATGFWAGGALSFIVSIVIGLLAGAVLGAGAGGVAGLITGVPATVVVLGLVAVRTVSIIGRASSFVDLLVGAALGFAIGLFNPLNLLAGTLGGGLIGGILGPVLGALAGKVGATIVGILIGLGATLVSFLPLLGITTVVGVGLLIPLGLLLLAFAVIPPLFIGIALTFGAGLAVSALWAIPAILIAGAMTLFALITTNPLAWPIGFGLRSLFGLGVGIAAIALGFLTTVSVIIALIVAAVVVGIPAFVIALVAFSLPLLVFGVALLFGPIAVPIIAVGLSLLVGVAVGSLTDIGLSFLFVLVGWLAGIPVGAVLGATAGTVVNALVRALGGAAIGAIVGAVTAFLWFLRLPFLPKSATTRGGNQVPVEPAAELRSTVPVSVDDGLGFGAKGAASLTDVSALVHA